MKRIMSMLILFALSAFSQAAPELKGSPDELRGFLHPSGHVVTLTGNAEEKSYSDKAVVSLVITTESKTLSEALVSNGSIREKVSAALVNAGIDSGVIKSSKFSSSPNYGWFGSKPSSYKIVNRMAITIMEEKMLKEIALVADLYDEVLLSDTAFEHSERDAFNEKVRAKALSKIMQQKSFYEEALGIKLVAIGIRDSHVRHQATRGALVLEEVIVTAAKVSKGNKPEYKNVGSQAQQSSFDEVKYEAVLSVDFKISE